MNDYDHGLTDQTPVFVLVSHGCVKDTYQDAYLIDWTDSAIILRHRENTVLIPWHAVVSIEYQTPDPIA